MNAVLISKSGNITCQHLEAPRICFAWETLTVNGACVGGEVTGGHITVTGKVMASTLQSCGHIVVNSLEVNHRAPTVVLLSNTIECDLYNRKMDSHSKGLVRSVNEATKNIDTAQMMDSYTHHMIHTAYRTALFYLFGGVDSASRAVELQGKQTKALYLSQLIGFAEEYVKFYSVAYESPEEHDSDTIEDFTKAIITSFALVKNDIAGIPEDFGSSHRQYLQDRCAEYLFMTKKLQREYKLDTDTTYLETLFKKAIGKWRDVLGETKREVKVLIDSFGLDKDLLVRMEHEPETLEPLLEETLAEILARPKNDDSQRGRSPLIRLLKTTADRLKRSIEVNHNSIVKCRREILEARKELLEKLAIKFRDPVPGGCSLESNYYAADVIISASKLSRRGRDTNMAKVIILANPIQGKTVFHLRDTMVQRQV